MRFDFVDDDMRHVIFFLAPPFFLRGTGTAPASAAANATLEFLTRFPLFPRLFVMFTGAFDHAPIVFKALS